MLHLRKVRAMRLHTHVWHTYELYSIIDVPSHRTYLSSHSEKLLWSNPAQKSKRRMQSLAGVIKCFASSESKGPWSLDPYRRSQLLINVPRHRRRFRHRLLSIGIPTREGHCRFQRRRQVRPPWGWHMAEVGRVHARWESIRCLVLFAHMYYFFGLLYYLHNV